MEGEPFDYEELEEFHQDLAEYRAAQTVIETSSKDELAQFIAAHMAMTRATKDLLERIVLVLERGIVIPPEDLVKRLKPLAEAIVVVATDEEDD